MNTDSTDGNGQDNAHGFLPRLALSEILSAVEGSLSKGILDIETLPSVISCHRQALSGMLSDLETKRQV